jgi:hypothetical protein
LAPDPDLLSVKVLRRAKLKGHGGDERTETLVDHFAPSATEGQVMEWNPLSATARATVAIHSSLVGNRQSPGEDIGHHPSVCSSPTVHVEHGDGFGIVGAGGPQRDAHGDARFRPATRMVA